MSFAPEDYQAVLDRFAALADPKYKAFHERLIPGDEHPAARCRDDLVSVKRIDAGAPESSRVLSLVCSAEGLRRILEDRHVMARTYAHDLIHLCRRAVQVYDDDRLGRRIFLKGSLERRG